MKPLLLDLCCSAGGATKGYQRAGFYVVGVDIEPQPHYCGDEFVQTDAVEYLAANAGRFDAFHASPPCQRFSVMSACRPGLADEYPDLVTPLRFLLQGTGKPYVIENVPGSPLLNPVMLCGHMFGLKLYRHRLFESNLLLMAPPHPKHVIPGGRAGHWKPDQIISVSGNCSPIALAREAMGIDWMNRAELAESIPPAYSEHIGSQLLSALGRVAA